MSALFEPRFPARWMYALIVAFYFVVYSPVLFISYAFNDDYPLLAWALQDHLRIVVQSILWEGRPLYALFVDATYGSARGIGDLGAIRAIGVAGIGAVSALAYRAFCQASLPRAAAVGAALLYGVTPPFQVYAAWAECAVFSWSAVLAALAFFVCDSAAGARTGWLRLAGAVGLLTAAFAIYQPAAMVFWNFAAIAWLLRHGLPSARAVGVACAVMLASLILEFGIVKFGLYAMSGLSLANPRSALVEDYYGKLIWFLQSPLIDSSNVFWIQPSIWISLFAALLIVTGFWLYSGRRLRPTLVRLAIAILLIPASYTPNLVVAEDWSSYRTQVALTGSVFIFLVAAFIGWARLLRAGWLITAVCAAAVAAGVLSAARNVTTEFAVPQALEYQLLQSALLHTDFSPGDKTCFNLATWKDGFAPVERYDEFGLVSASQEWNPEPMSWLIMHEQGSPYADLFKQDAGSLEETTESFWSKPVVPGCKEINLDEILRRASQPMAP